MAEKHRCVQTLEAERVKRLKSWQQNRHGKSTQAATELGVSKGTLLGWRKDLSDPALSFIKDLQPDPERFRKKGAESHRKLKPYDNRVVEFYRNCIRDGGTVTSTELLQYCCQSPDFVLQNENTKQSWVWRFIEYYRPIFAKNLPRESVGVNERRVNAVQDAV